MARGPLVKLAEKVDMNKVPRAVVNWPEHGCQSSVCLYVHPTITLCFMWSLTAKKPLGIVVLDC